MCGGGGSSNGGGQEEQTPMTGYRPGDVKVETLAPANMPTQKSNITQGNPHLDFDTDEHNISRTDTSQPNVSGNPGKDIFAPQGNTQPDPQQKSGLMSTIGNAIVNTLAFAAGGPAGVAVVNAGRYGYGKMNPDSAIGITAPEAIGNTLSAGMLSKGKLGMAGATSIAGNFASGKNLTNPQDPNTMEGAISNMTNIEGNMQGFGRNIMTGVASDPTIGRQRTTNVQNLGMISSQPVVGTRNNIGDIPGIVQERRQGIRNEFGKIFN